MLGMCNCVLCNRYKMSSLLFLCLFPFVFSRRGSTTLSGNLSGFAKVLGGQGARGAFVSRQASVLADAVAAHDVGSSGLFQQARYSANLILSIYVDSYRHRPSTTTHHNSIL